MIKKICLASVVTLSIMGCGGGDTPQTVNNYYGYDENVKKRADMPNSTSSNNKQLDEKSYEKAPQNLVKNIKSLGYNNIDDSCKLGDDRIAFIHNDNGNREFCIYDRDEGGIISRVQNFNATNIVSVINNNIYFSNNQFINIENPWNVEINTYDSLPQTTQHTNYSSGSIGDMLRSRYGSSLVSWNYTYAKGGIFVSIRSGNSISLHLLDSDTLVDEKTLKVYSYPMSQIIGLQGGVVKLVYSNGKTVLYDYLDDRDISNNDNHSNSEYNSGDAKSLISNALDRHYTTKNGKNMFDGIVSIESLENNIFVVTCEYSPFDTYMALFIVKIDNSNNVILTELDYANEYVGAYINSISINRSNNTINYRRGRSSEGYYILTYNYVDLYVVEKKVYTDDDAYDYSDNSTTPSSDTYNNSVTYSKISDYLENLVTYSYSQQGGGIFVIGTKNGSYSFYRFNANPIELEKAFYNVGLSSSTSIYGINALANGRFQISTSSGNYIFNYFDGTLE